MVGWDVVAVVEGGGAVAAVAESGLAAALDRQKIHLGWVAEGAEAGAEAVITPLYPRTECLVDAVRGYAARGCSTPPCGPHSV